MWCLIQHIVREIYASYGYEEVITPQIFDTELWRRSGHYDNYKDNMYFFSADEREYGLKPMNCPHHHKIFASSPKSYRDLPVRMAEYGTCYRYEKSGELSGLTRVRSLTQDDAHIFCLPEQVEEEFTNSLELTNENGPRVTIFVSPLL